MNRANMPGPNNSRRGSDGGDDDNHHNIMSNNDGGGVWNAAGPPAIPRPFQQPSLQGQRPTMDVLNHELIQQASQPEHHHLFGQELSHEGNENNAEAIGEDEEDNGRFTMGMQELHEQSKAIVQDMQLKVQAIARASQAETQRADNARAMEIERLFHEQYLSDQEDEEDEEDASRFAFAETQFQPHSIGQPATLLGVSMDAPDTGLATHPADTTQVFGARSQHHTSFGSASATVPSGTASLGNAAALPFAAANKGSETANGTAVQRGNMGGRVAISNEHAVFLAQAQIDGNVQLFREECQHSLQVQQQIDSGILQSHDFQHHTNVGSVSVAAPSSSALLVNDSNTGTWTSNQTQTVPSVFSVSALVAGGPGPTSQENATFLAQFEFDTNLRLNQQANHYLLQAQRQTDNALLQNEAMTIEHVQRSAQEYLATFGVPAGANRADH